MAAVEAAERPRLELTVRGVVLGVLITLVFTAANVFLGLKVALTFATSIPAAVISMALLRAFKNSTIVENNIVQTVASAAGAMAAVVFVLPGLIIVGAWTGFPFWMTFGVCALGGVLGVMYTIPLRRALVTQSDLPYPEGVAAAQVLIVGSGSEGGGAEAEADSKLGLLAITLGSIAGAAYALVTTTRVFASEVAGYIRTPNGGATGLGAQASLALFGAGHLVGVAVGAAMTVGLVFAWGIAVPVLTALHPAAAGPIADWATDIWRHQVRFIGAGAIGVAAIWTLAKLAVPLVTGVASALAAERLRKAGGGGDLPRTEQDIPIGVMAVISLACLVPIAVLLAGFLAGGPLGSLMIPLTIAAVLYIAVAGFAVAAVCGYMAGLIGSSNSPVSGMAILSVLGAALIIAAVGLPVLKGGDAKPLVAFALLVTSVLIAVAVSANDNLQDLKTGQLVDATPWRQQVALVIGVIAGSAVIPVILNLLNKAYGFAGSPMHGISANPLAAPQATLISTIALGVVGGNLQWGLIGIGGLVGAGLVLADELLRRGGRHSLPPLGAALAIYLPSSVTVPVIIGAFSGYAYDRWVSKRPNGEVAKRLGILLVSGYIVGDSLLNVAHAGLIVATGKGAPLALVPEAFAPATPLAIAVYVLVAAGLYLWAARRAAKA
ncbi:MAG: peptide transporter [Phenylobacterium sp.]|nr:peptide transporter [Phenylobacterium sp.]